MNTQQAGHYEDIDEAIGRLMEDETLTIEEYIEVLSETRHRIEALVAAAKYDLAHP